LLLFSLQLSGQTGVFWILGVLAPCGFELGMLLLNTLTIPLTLSTFMGLFIIFLALENIEPENGSLSAKASTSRQRI
jgi:hypothetical protein